jgi:hypothetical protein
MNREPPDYDRVMWKVRIFYNIRIGTILLFLAAVCLVIAIAAAPSQAGTISGATLFVICLAAGMYMLHQANRIRKTEPKVWLADEPRPEDEPRAKMR